MASTVTFFTSDMDKVREEVRALQEQRATVLMYEIAELQKERDIAAGRIRRLERTVLEMQLENAALVQKCQESSNCIATLERSLMEEQLMVSDLKRKLDSAVKSCASQKKADQCTKETGPSSIRQISVLQTESPPMPKTNITRNGRTHTSLGAIDTSVPKRYVLATAQVRSISSQTEEDNIIHTKDLPPSITEDELSSKQLLEMNISNQVMQAHSKLISDVEKLKEEKMKLESELDGSKYEQHCKTQCKSLQNECRSLKTGLVDVIKTVKENLQKFEDDLDICKVIYTLHGSLSQENTVLEDTRKKLNESKKRCDELETNCNQLTTILSEKEEELKRCLTWIQKHLSHRHSLQLIPEKHSRSSGQQHTRNI